jgi:hypothetical protein
VELYETSSLGKVGVRHTTSMYLSRLNRVLMSFTIFWTQNDVEKRLK